MNKYVRTALLVCLGIGGGWAASPNAIPNAINSIRGLSPERLKADLKARGFDCDILVDAEKPKGSIVYKDVVDPLRITNEEMAEIKAFMKALEVDCFKLLVEDKDAGHELSAISATKKMLDDLKVMRQDIELGVRPKDEEPLLNEHWAEAEETMRENEFVAARKYGGPITEFARKHGGVQEVSGKDVSSKEMHGFTITRMLHAKNAVENPRNSMTSQPYTLMVGSPAGSQILADAFRNPPARSPKVPMSVLHYPKRGEEPKDPNPMLAGRP